MKLIDTITWPFQTASSSSGAAPAAGAGALSPSGAGPVAFRSAFGAARAGLHSLIAALSPVAVPATLHRRLTGLIFVGAGPFVQAVARALDEYPDLSPLPAITAASLRLRQARAYGWLQLRAVLSRAQERAAGNYVYEQGLAMEEALQVVQALRNGQEHQRLHGDWPPSPGLEERRLALGPALAVLADRNRRKRDIRLRTAATLAHAAGKPKRASPARGRKTRRTGKPQKR